MSRYAANQGHIGIAVQEDKDTAEWPEMYVKATDGTTLTPTNEFEQQRELGDGIYPGFSMKTMHKLDGKFNILGRPDIATMLIGAMFGSDSISGESAPYTHTMVPNTAPSNVPWLSIVRSIAGGQVLEQTKNCRIKEIAISGESNGPIKMAISFLGLNGEEITRTYTPSYESNLPFMFNNGTFTKDAGATTEIKSFDITIKAIMDESDQTTDIELADALVIRYEVDISAVIKVSSDNVSEYSAVYYTSTAPSTSLEEGSIVIDLNYGTGASEKELKLDCQKVIYTAQPLEHDAQSDDSMDFEITAHAEKDATYGLITVTTESARATGPAATRGTQVLTFTGVGVDADTFTINENDDARVYELSTDGEIEETSDIEVDISGDQSADAVVAAIATAINADSSAEVTAEYDTDDDTVTVKSKVPGTVGNIAVSEDLTNASWGDTALAGGTNNG